jgi:hypothetical protein
VFLGNPEISRRCLATGRYSNIDLGKFSSTLYKHTRRMHMTMAKEHEKDNNMYFFDY